MEEYGTIIVFVALALVATIIKSLMPKRRRRRSTPKRAKSGKVVPFSKAKPTSGGMWDPRNQLEAVGQVNFERSRIMNASEYRVFKALEDVVAEIGGGYRVMAQVSLGEVIKPTGQGDWKTRKTPMRRSIPNGSIWR